MRSGILLPAGCATALLLVWSTRAQGAEIHAGPGQPTRLDRALKRARPGDVVIVHGGVYKPVAISCSGRENAPVTIKAAPGIRPVFDGSAVGWGQKGSVWNKVKSEIYSAPCNEIPLTVIVDDTIMRKAESLETMTEGSYFVGRGYVHVWCPGGDDPSTHETGVVVKKWGGVNIRGDWVILDGFLSRFASGTGVAVFGKHCEVRNCEAKWCAGNGIRFFKPCSHSRAVNNVVHDNFCAQFPRGTRKGGWGYGLGTGSQVPDCEFIGNTVYGNNGEGLGCYNQSHRTVMRNNIVHDNWSVNIYIDSCADCVVDGNFVYNTGVCRHPEERRSHPPGIMCADERYEGGPYLARLTVINNVVTGCRQGFCFAFWSGNPEESALKDSLIANNTFVDNEVGIQIGPTQKSVFANNIILQTNRKRFVLTHKRDGDRIDAVWQNNIFFGTNRQGFAWLGRNLGFEQWQKACAGAGGNVWADPLLATNTGAKPDAHRPQRGSICIDSGTAVEHVDHDFAGVARPQGATCDIGAYEYYLQKPKRKPRGKARKPSRPDKAAEKKKQEEELLTLGRSAAPELRKWVIEGVASGRRVHVYVTIMGANTRARIAAADEAGISVIKNRQTSEVSWDSVSPSQLYEMARKYAAAAGESVPAGRRELLKAFAFANGLQAE